MATVKYEPGQWGRDQWGNPVIVVMRREMKDVRGTVYRYWVTDRTMDSPMRLLDLGAFTAEAMPEVVYAEPEAVTQTIVPGFEAILASAERRDGL